MSNSTSQIRHFILNGSTKESGGDLHLGDGELTLVDNTRSVDGGLAVADNIAYADKNARNFILRVGTYGVGLKNNTRTTSTFHSSSKPFALNEVVDMGINMPQISEPKVDIIRIGYDGHDPSTSFKFRQGMKPLHIRFEMSEGSIPYSGGNVNSEVVDIKYDFNEYAGFPSCEEIENCSPINCKPIIEDVISLIKNRQIGGGARTVGDVVEVLPILGGGCENTFGEIEYYTYQMSVCDEGDVSATAEVQAKYPGQTVRRVKRSGAITTYEILTTDSNPPQSFTKYYPGGLATCGVCESGSLIQGGYVSYITISDNGESKQGEIAIALGTTNVTPIGNDLGNGTYVVVTPEKVTAQQIIALSTELGGYVFTFKQGGKLSDMCGGEEGLGNEWTLVNTCYGSNQVYKISLADDICGENRLQELQDTYPDLNIVVAPSNNSQAVVTLAGGATGSTGNISIGGTNYLVTFTTDLATTATNFVATHSSALSALGITASNAGGVITINGTTSALGTVAYEPIGESTLTGEVVNTVLPLTAGCMTSYLATVLTDINCEGCDEQFVGFYTSKEPRPFDGNKWEKVEEVVPEVEGCLCGIEIRSKIWKIVPEKGMKGDFSFIEDSVRIYGAGAHYKSDGTFDGMETVLEPVKVTRIQNKVNRDAVAGNLLNKEREMGYYFQDTDVKYSDSLKTRFGAMLASRFNDLDAQYANLWIKINHSKQAGHLNQPIMKPIIYNFYVHVGKIQRVMDLFNAIAGATSTLSGIKIGGK